jgi:hypothetical protein
LIAAVINDEKAATQALDTLRQKNIKLITIDNAAGLHKD